MFTKLRHAIARVIAPRMVAVRQYAAARYSRLSLGFGISSTTADSELRTSLAALRNRSRQLIRDSAYAKRAQAIVVNNVIGAGVGMQAQVMTTRNVLAEAVNDAIESAWHDWSRAENCHTGGALHFGDLERAAMGQVFAAGEVFIRKHPRPFGRSRVPLALELIEAERIADEYNGVSDVGNTIRNGVEVDGFERPVAYFVRRRHPGDVLTVSTQADQIERIPAEQILHLKLTNRWPQTRGEPWMHAAILKLNDMAEYTAAELAAARASANYFGTIESNDDNPLAATETEDGAQFYDIQPNVIQKLPPGEKFNFHAPNRPNAALDPFMRHMLREVAAAVGVSYESLSRDYSQSNYSSSRLALLDDRDTWRVLQQWWVRSFREPLHREWLRAAVLARSVQGISLEAYGNDMQRYEAVRFKPRGWSWVDPTKEVEAYKAAELAGYITKTQIIAQTANGLDIEDVINERRRELDMLKAADIETDTTTPAAPPAPAPTPPPPPDDAEDDTPQEPPARLFSFPR